MLAVPYDAKKLRPDAEYFASEKLDGVRATWDGAVLRTRTGNVVEGAPDWFLASLPPAGSGEVFDGELFAGRGNFAVATSTVRRKNGVVDTDWRNITYKIFDCFGPEEEKKRPYAETFARLRERVPKANLVPQIRVKTAAEIAALFERLVAAGAEGLMIRRADSPTEKKRSAALMKMKAADDAPAVVVAHVPGRAGSKYEGVLGALTCRWAGEAERSEAERSDEADDEKSSTTTFNVGTGLTDAQRRAGLPGVGATIRVRFASVDARTGRPRHPVLVTN
jgi:DNA ligase-1